MPEESVLNWRARMSRSVMFSVSRSTLVHFPTELGSIDGPFRDWSYNVPFIDALEPMVKRGGASVLHSDTLSGDLTLRVHQRVGPTGHQWI